MKPYIHFHTKIMLINKKKRLANLSLSGTIYSISLSYFVVPIFDTTTIFSFWVGVSPYGIYNQIILQLECKPRSVSIYKEIE